MQKDQLLDVLDKTVQNLNQERNQEEHVHILKRRLDERAYEDRERLLISMIGGDLNSFKDRKPVEYFDMPAFDKEIAAAVIKFDVFYFFRGKESGERQSHLRELYRQVRSVIGGEGITAQNSTAMNEIILCLPVEGGDRNHVYDVIRRIRLAFSGTEMPEAVIGVGSAAKSLPGFPGSFMQAKAALDNIFFMNDCEILFFDDIIRRDGIQGPEVYSFFTSAAGYSKKILNGVVSSDADGVTALSEELFEFIKGNAFDRSLVCNYFAGLVSELSTLLSSGGGMPDAPGMAGGDLMETLNGFIRLDDMKKWFLELLLRANHLISAKKGKKEEYIVEKVMDIIKKEYKDSIGIETIAARLELSPNYLGSLFKRCVGKRFTEVLTDVRMKKAKELLASGQGNVFETAGEVGFVNAAHFCTVFKKTHGISPMEYQKKFLHKNTQY